VPVLVYRYVVDCPYPGRNTVAQLESHLRRLAADGYRLATPEQLAWPLAQPHAVVVLEDADLAVLQAVDAVLAELGGRAVYAGHRGILARAVPGKPAPDELRRLAETGRWLIASAGPENDRRQSVAADGRRGNPFTHPIVKNGRLESDDAFRKRLETEFAASADVLGDAPEKLLVYPYGDYGQASLDTSREYRDVYRDAVASSFDQAIFFDDGGFLAPDHDPLRIPARVVPAAWDADRLAEHLRQQNPGVRAQLELAKLLYWNRQHEEANYWFARALAAGADPKAVAFNRGANALQQGDLPVALDQLRLAQELDPESEKTETALANARDRKRLTLEIGARYWEDNEDRSYEQYSAQGGGYVLDYLRLGGFADANRWQTDGLGDERGTRIGAEARWHLYPQIWLEGQLWQLQFDSELDDLVGGDLRLHLPNRWLGGYAELLDKAVAVKYSDIPHFPVSTVSYQKGELVCGLRDGKPVLAMNGRFHFYEGWEMWQTAYPIGVFKLLGIKKLIITNAAGGISTDYRPGDLVAVTDHIKLSPDSPLRGANIPEFGERFFDMQHVYDRQLLALAKAKASELGFELKEGVYGYMAGPQYETPAEIRMLRALGATVVGMSTVAEVIFAAQCRIPVLCISCVSNMAAGITGAAITEEEVLETGRLVSRRFTSLVDAVVASI